jgi:LAO/AO transport system kinase
MQDLNAWVDAIRSGDRSSLSKAITLVESIHADHVRRADELMRELFIHNPQSYRIGITGVPGVGKSTFLNALIQELLKAEPESKIAVLAIDPSSSSTSGSILGDKTRMEDIASDSRVYIRPTPSKTRLGGVAQNTLKSIQLCEAAGFNYVFIETVGVGQSETAVSTMIDALVLLMLPSSGDELQGIKRGIMELADILLVNKADGDRHHAAKSTAKQLSMALHLFPSRADGWSPRVATCSALESAGMQKALELLKTFRDETKANGSWDQKRRKQQQKWLLDAMKERALTDWLQKHSLNEPDLLARADVWTDMGNPYVEMSQILEK